MLSYLQLQVVSGSHNQQHNQVYLNVLQLAGRRKPAFGKNDRITVWCYTPRKDVICSRSSSVSGLSAWYMIWHWRYQPSRPERSFLI